MRVRESVFESAWEECVRASEIVWECVKEHDGCLEIIWQTRKPCSSYVCVRALESAWERVRACGGACGSVRERVCKSVRERVGACESVLQSAQERA